MHFNTALRSFVLPVLICTAVANLPSLAADARMPEPSGSGSTSPEIPIDSVRPVRQLPAEQPQPDAVQWDEVRGASVRFLGLMHGFRWLTEPGTRAGGIGLGQGYINSVTNMHGWSDGDPFYVNYIGHPMQGSVAARIFQMNDPRFSRVEFGSSPTYWKSRLRGAAYSALFSAQFELGPLSEASIGHIQAHYPQQGLVDHVVTPALGLGWTVAEDAVDRYLIKAIEDRTTNPWVRLLVRSGLNPTRTLASVLNGRVPWYRENRAGVYSYTAGTNILEETPTPISDQSTFEFTAGPGYRTFAGKGCIGGGAEAAWRLSRSWMLAADVNGCKLRGLETNFSGDALVYQVGPRWSPNSNGRWAPYAHVLVGGIKVTHEQLYPEKKKLADLANPSHDPAIAERLHDSYTRQEEANGLAISAATGVDYKLTRALALRVASVEYLRSSIGTLGGLNYNQGLQLSTGLVLRMGTW